MLPAFWPETATFKQAPVLVNKYEEESVENPYRFRLNFFKILGKITTVSRLASPPIDHDISLFSVNKPTIVLALAQRAAVKLSP